MSEVRFCKKTAERPTGYGFAAFYLKKLPVQKCTLLSDLPVQKCTLLALSRRLWVPSDIKLTDGIVHYADTLLICLNSHAMRIE